MIRVGVDVGGTFTDIILERIGAGGEQSVVVTKVSSTPHDQSEGVVQGILNVCKLAGVEPGDIDAVFHGTTVATNIVIERGGARVGMITTRGFRDIMHMGRHKRPHNFSLQFDVPWQSKPLVKRRDRLVVTERILPPDGRIEVPLAEDEVKQAAELFAKRGMDAVIIGFLFSFLNDEHEQRAKEIVSSVLPDTYVCCSSEVVNSIREYERFSSTAMNAYIGPKTSAYLRKLEGRLRAAGVGGIIRIMQSNGGITTVEKSSELPIGLLMSGPAGGVIGGRWTGDNCGKSNIITIDIGGTSADIGVIQDGDLRIKNPRDTEVGLLPVLVPMIDIDAIGAGGGSIAYLDPGGAFRVGPRSAGAVPGPACYGKGGTEPTVTDAQVVLGRLDPEQFLGGDIKIDAALSETAIRDHIAEPLGLSLDDAALGILKIVNNNMALAINANSMAKGVDPRNFTLMGFGGAGPLHAVSLAEAIHAKDIISPVQPGITAATGLLVTDLQYEYTHPLLMVLDNASDADFKTVNDALDGLMEQAHQQLDADGIPREARRFQRIAECRYVGQGFELRAAMPDGTVDAGNARTIIDSFYDEHKKIYGHAFRDQACELITLRLV
ncbi:MAG: hydantoinase/oxoprolinase family protein, partial [Nitratireductor sp.]